MIKQKGYTDAMTVVGILIFVGVLMYGGYQLKRWFNYSFGYQGQVIEEVCNMVKPEYLNDPSLCKE